MKKVLKRWKNVKFQQKIAMFDPEIAMVTLPYII